MIWILLVLLYGLFKGLREIAKKKAMTKNSVMEVLVAYTILSFVMVIPEAKAAMGMPGRFYIYVALKSLVIFIAWMCSFRSLKHLPVSLYGILDLSRVLFATFLAVTVIHETLNFNQIMGMLLVCCGLMLLKFKPAFLYSLLEKGNSQSPTDSKTQIQSDGKYKLYVFCAFVSCLLNAVSGLMDKILMKDINSSQLQFWYMLFLVIYYVIYMLVTRTPMSKTVLKNGWIWLMALIFVIGDKALFVANANPDSRVTIMTLIKQSGCVITIIGGRLVFKEKDTTYRLVCAAVVIAGIVISVL
ncbi:MAG: EamA family transporter [Clostridia bacterium]|nr:EamA family transporter [Clostridia bacterium]